MNVRGMNGFINHTGEHGATSDLIDCRDEKFFDNIEDGIYSTVKALVDHGYYTCSSCQGHIGYNEIRSVTVQGEKENINFIKYLIWNANQNNEDVNIRFIVLKVFDEINIYKDVFTDPEKIQILFGKCSDSRTRKSQIVFEDYIKRFPMKHVPYNQVWEHYSLDTGSHVDTMC